MATRKMNEEMTHQTIIVTIDGPAGSGKSSAARSLAKKLGFDFLDTGAMYRAVAWACLDRQVNPDDATCVSELTAQIRIELDGDRILLDGAEISSQIRGNEVSQISSVIARHPKVRDSLVRLQRQFADGKQVVSEGRDQGTVVFPDAACKFYLEARPEVRAERRHDELVSNGETSNFDTLVTAIRERDERDANRSVAPLRPAEDAKRIDTSEMTLAEVIRQLELCVRESMGEGMENSRDEQDA